MPGMTHLEWAWMEVIAPRRLWGKEKCVQGGHGREEAVSTWLWGQVWRVGGNELPGWTLEPGEIFTVDMLYR